MPYVKIRENEPFEVALRRFKRTCEKAGVVAEVRSREFYEKPTSIRKREKAAAVKRNIKNLKRELNRRTRLYWFVDFSVATVLNFSAVRRQENWLRVSSAFIGVY